MTQKRALESVRAKQAWTDYLSQGPDRSLEKLHRLYLARAAGADRGGTKAAPTVRLTTLKEWSAAFGWQDRLAQIAAEDEQRIREAKAAKVQAILDRGYARMEARVESLDLLATLLVNDLLRRTDGSDDPGDPRFWLRDVKMIGAGEDAERVEIVRFNRDQFEVLRGLMRDLAEETGGRIKRQEVAGKDGQPFGPQVIITLPDNGR